MLKKGWYMQGNKDKIILIKPLRNGKINRKCKQIRFDTKVKTAKGLLYCTILNRNSGNEAVLTLTNIEPIAQNLDIVKSTTQWHDEMGHMCDNESKKIAKRLGIKLRGVATPCESCMRAKARRKDIPTRSNFGTLIDMTVDKECEKTKICELISLDLSKIGMPKDTSIEMPILRRPQWRMLQDKATGRKFCDFYRSKDSMIQPTCQLINKWTEDF